MELINCLLSIMNGNFPKDDKNLISFESSKVKIDLLDGADSLSFFGDGETFNKTNSWKIKCYSEFLNVFSPKDQSDLSSICGQTVSLH